MRPQLIALAVALANTTTVGDLHHVITAARRMGGKVVPGGHSLGGGVVTAYATWNFGGHPAFLSRLIPFVRTVSTSPS
jgi:hypothetical protein